MNIFEHPDNFVNRHIGPGDGEVKEMLKTIGVDSLDQLIGETIPSSIKLKQPLKMNYWLI